MAAQQMISETKGVGQIINERRYFEVPRHQRDFAWPLGAVEQYIEDIVSAMEGSDDDYFIGLIVLIDAANAVSKRYEILDGQQRLATTTMIYSAIRQWLRENGLDIEASKIQNDFIGISEIGEEQDESRVTLNINNKSIFQDIVVNHCSDKTIELKLLGEGRYSSTRKLIEAVLFCRKYIGELAEKQGSEKKVKAKKLFQLAKYLRDKVQVNCLYVSAPENAYRIFESLNDRGIDLSVLDLLKNYLLQGAGIGNENIILNNWTRMTSTIGDRKGDDFLKAFWTSRYGRIQKGRLFNELKLKYNTRSSIMELSADLAKSAEVFGNLESSDSELWKQYSPAAQEYVKTLSLLGAKQTHPIIMSAIDKFKSEEVEKLLKYLVILIFRYQLIGRGRTGKLEIQSAIISESIFTGKLKSAKAVWDKISVIIPPDGEFEEDFSRYIESKSAIARWILRELEAQKWIMDHPGQNPQTMPISDPDFVNLEHILPKNPNQEWKQVLNNDKYIVDECLERLGNLCLFEKLGNKSEASSGFAIKKIKYVESEFLLTKGVGLEFTEWNRESIEYRQKQLAKLALVRWPALWS